MTLVLNNLFEKQPRAAQVSNATKKILHSIFPFDSLPKSIKKWKIITKSNVQYITIKRLTLISIRKKYALQTFAISKNFQLLNELQVKLKSTQSQIFPPQSDKKGTNSRHKKCHYNPRFLIHDRISQKLQLPAN